MKLIIAGGRNYRLAAADLAKLDAIEGVTLVISGGCRGVDEDGERWAHSRNIVVKRFLPDWEAYGAAAGPLRNRDMAREGDAVAIFPGGKGTQSMEREAKAAGLRIFDFRSAPHATTSRGTWNTTSAFTSASCANSRRDAARG